MQASAPTISSVGFRAGGCAALVAARPIGETSGRDIESTVGAEPRTGGPGTTGVGGVGEAVAP